MKYPCPCCGYLTLPVPQEEAIAYICPVCLWENDVFTHCADEPSDENHGMSLNEGRKNYKRFGAVHKYEFLTPRAPFKEEIPHHSGEFEEDYSEIEKTSQDFGDYPRKKDFDTGGAGQ